MEVQQGLIFVSYASPDRERVRPFHDYLASKGFGVWMDFLCIKPGQNWDFEIRLALERAAIVLIFISNTSVSRRGYVQREIKIALDKLNEKLAGDIFVIPILLDDDAIIPDQLKSLQVAKASDDNCLNQIDDAIRFQFGRIGSHLAEIQNRAHVNWTSVPQHESWDGLPGYEIEVKRLILNSERYPEIAIINDLLRGEIAKDILGARAVKLSQETDRFNYGQSKEQRSNMIDGYFREPIIIGRVISLQYLLSWFYAGAAHGGGKLRTYSFVLTPLAWIRSLDEIFVDPYGALAVVQEKARKQITYQLKEMDSEPDMDWVVSGTDKWGDFDSFTFEEKGIQINFQQYQVAAYVFGTQNAFISYDEIIKIMKQEYISALEIEQILWETSRGPASTNN
jgi:hypothetical protein